jgi:DNA-binding NarL/FixJ family response regulator
VAQVIDLQPDMCVCGEATTSAEVIEGLQFADGIVLDLMLGLADGLALIKQMKNLKPECRILVFSMHNEDTFAPLVLEAGAVGYLMKSEPVERIIDGLRRVLQGEIVLSGRMATRLLKVALREPIDSPNQDPIWEKLSARERHIFQHVGAGASPTELSHALGVSVKTIESHFAHICRKLEIKGMAQLRKKAADWINGR